MRIESKPGKHYLTRRMRPFKQHRPLKRHLTAPLGKRSSNGGLEQPPTANWELASFTRERTASRLYSDRGGIAQAVCGRDFQLNLISRRHTSWDLNVYLIQTRIPWRDPRESYLG